MTFRTLEIFVVRHKLAAPFVIARGAKTEATCIVAIIEQDGARGRGECTPYPRYGESIDTVLAGMESVRAALEAGAGRSELQSLLPAGAARNALDCALWDLEAKSLNQPAYRLVGLDRVAPVVTAFTLSVDTPEAMADAARRAADRPLLKIKLAGEGDPERLRAVRAAAPEAELIVDANESWRPEWLDSYFEVCAELGVALVEQPLPAQADHALVRASRWPTPVCADESAHDSATLGALRERYDAINVKLDKTGGLTEALKTAREAKEMGFSLFVGCMASSSLAIAPALLLTPHAQFVDLDGPLLLAHDCPHGLHYEGSLLFPPTSKLWG